MFLAFKNLSIRAVVVLVDLIVCKIDWNVLISSCMIQSIRLVEPSLLLPFRIVSKVTVFEVSVFSVSCSDSKIDMQSLIVAVTLLFVLVVELDSSSPSVLILLKLIFCRLYSIWLCGCKVCEVF